MKLPEAVCSLCGKSKIRGLFTPLELQTYVRCRVCIGEINVKRRPHLSSQRLSLRAGKGVVYLAKHGLLGELRQMARDAKGDAM